MARMVRPARRNRPAGVRVAGRCSVPHTPDGEPGRSGCEDSDSGHPVLWLARNGIEAAPSIAAAFRRVAGTYLRTGGHRRRSPLRLPRLRRPRRLDAVRVHPAVPVRRNPRRAPSARWYEGQTVAHGQVVAVIFEVDTAAGRRLAAGWATASEVMHGQAAWTTPGRQPVGQL